MEKIDYNSLLLLLVLLPGFVSIIIYNKLIYRETSDTFSKVVEALIYSLAIYFGTALITSSFIIKGVTVFDANGKKTINWDYNKLSIAVTIGLAVALPIIMGWMNRHDLFLTMFRKLKITNRTSRESIWLDVFYSTKRSVIVHMKDGGRLFGWPLFFSNKIDLGPLYLTQTAWINEDNEYVDSSDLDGIFLVDHTNIAHIEFLKHSKEIKK